MEEHMSAVVDTQSLRKEYGTLVAVRDANLVIEKGSVVGLVGPNGAGKTTLLRMLATLLRPTRGTAHVVGYDILEHYQEVRRHVGFMPDFFNLYNDLTLEQCLSFFSAAYRMPADSLESRIGSALEYVYLSDRRTDRISHLSRGMTQRLGVACMLVHEPDLLLLDEPASGLDPKARIQLRQVLQQLAADGKTVVISSHILTELDSLCSDLCIMHSGRIVERGSVHDVTNKVSGAGRVEVSLVDSATPDMVEIVKNMPFVQEVTQAGNSLLVRMESDAEHLASLNRSLVEGGIGVCGLTIQKHNLESVFMQISSREEADHVE
jgi:ABC-2 type transport system ATP-binding protein